MIPFQVNILVKDDGSACLADFGLISIVMDPNTTDITTSTDGGTQGTYRWMGPELFYPNEYGLSKFQLTKESDCYAFGMVIYEVGSSKCWKNHLSDLIHRRRFSRGRSPSKKLKCRCRCRSRCRREHARAILGASLLIFGTSLKNAGEQTLGIDRLSQQFWKSSATSLVPRMSLLLRYANPGRCV